MIRSCNLIIFPAIEVYSCSVPRELFVVFRFITFKLAPIVYLFVYLNDNNVEEQMNFCNVHLVFDFVDVLLLLDMNQFT